MSLLEPKTIEEDILYFLRTGSRSTHELLVAIDRKESGVTKQGFYAALRRLKADEVVVVHKSTVSLNAAWVRRMQKLVDTVASVYVPAAESIGVLSLSEKESVSFSFSNTRHLDVFWGHTQSVLVARTPVSEPVYSYDPHYWFYIARKKTERALVEDIVQSGRQFLMTVGGTHYLDSYIKRDFADDLRQYHQEQLFSNTSYYVVVIGDFITEVRLDHRVSERIEKIYESATLHDESTRKNLERLLLIRAKHRLKITRNARKARELKSKLGKNFYVKK
jgi:hypothetical protein